MNWRNAFAFQAQSDFSVYQYLNRHQQPLCHQLHYLQMASEKLAKAFLSPPNGSPPEFTHFAFGRVLRVIKGRPEIREKFGYANNHHAFATYIESVIPIAEKVECLVPRDKTTPNVEYPWRNNGDVVAPFQYSFPELSPTELIKINSLLHHLFRIIAPTN